MSEELEVEEVEKPKKAKKSKAKAVVILKKDHHHGGKLYTKGTNLTELNANESSVAVMKDRGII